ncbi:MAG: hypothetical protein V1933_03400 [Candidatus Omnitrophota bacterium]
MIFRIGKSQILHGNNSAGLSSYFLVSGLAGEWVNGLAHCKPANRQTGKPDNRLLTGFTLIELLFVVAILLFVTALAVPRFKGAFDFLRAQDFVFDIVAFSRFAEAKSVSGGGINRLVIDISNRVMTVESFCVTENNGVAKEDWYLEKSRRIPDYLRFDPNEDKITFKFYPDGSSEAAVFKVTTASGKNYIISTEPATGYVKVNESSQ